MAAAVLAGCTRETAGGATGTPTPESSATPTATTTPMAASCSSVPPRCSAWNVRESCAADGFTWTSETCDGGCFAGTCSATACADECALGETGADGTCRLWDMGSTSFVDADKSGSMHDRARDFDARLWRESLPHGAVANTTFTDPTLSEVSFYSDLGDSALWTGSLLAAESWRYRATGAPAAADRIDDLVATLHRDFAITGSPGYLARFASPAGAPQVPEVESDCSLVHHCNVEFEGESWSWLGHTSRDQYTGVMLGLFLAYESVHDAALRATIRADVVAVARELATVRTDVPVHVDLGGIPIEATMDLENVILAPNETQDGRVWVVVNTSDFSDSDLYGAREFLPDVADAIKQIPGFSWVPPIKRPSSAIMLGSFIRMAIEMTDGVDGSEEDYAFLRAYYDAHADDWLDDAKGWSYDQNCGNGYYANHIAYISAYVWAVLEKDPGRQTKIRDDVLSGRLWASLDDHRNSYFAFLHGGTRLVPDPLAPEITAAVADLADFAPGPRVNLAVDLLDEYPHSDSCTQDGQPQSTIAVSVAERPADDFIWQRGPWVLWTWGNPNQTFSGTDYLAAYWAGRRYGFITDDRAGTCARWE